MLWVPNSHRTNEGMGMGTRGQGLHTNLRNLAASWTVEAGLTFVYPCFPNLFAGDYMEEIFQDVN